MYSRHLGISSHSSSLTPSTLLYFQFQFLELNSPLERGLCATTDTLKNPKCPLFTPETTEGLSQSTRFMNFLGAFHTMPTWCGKNLNLLSFLSILVTLILFSCCFRLYLKGHSGTAGKQSSLILHGAEFSTKDADNDNCMCKCALMLTGGEYNWLWKYSTLIGIYYVFLWKTMEEVISWVQTFE